MVGEGALGVRNPFRSSATTGSGHFGRGIGRLLYSVLYVTTIRHLLMPFDRWGAQRSKVEELLCEFLRVDSIGRDVDGDN